MDYGPPFGFPLRRNVSCLEDETDCGPSWGYFHSCCPGAAVCPGSETPYYNNVCCPNRSNCTEPLLASPHCANETAELYDSDGPFCCLPGEQGFSTSEGGVGCAKDPDDLAYNILTPISLR